MSMNKLPIGEIILKLRKEKGITQDQLGNYIGVSTPAVSKWESGISYPDITLLPVIATFFNVSIDKLLDFRIELSDDEVMKVFIECEKDFSSNDLESAIGKSKNYISMYPGSYYLKYKIGSLFNLYSWKSNSEEMHMKMVSYAIELFEEVAKNCTKIEFVEQVLFQLGMLYSSIDEEDKAIEVLNKIHKSQLDPNDILSGIYIQRGELKKARELLQSKLFKCINDISIACIGLADSYSKDEKDLNMVEKYYNLSINVRKAIFPEDSSVLDLTMEYLNLGQAYLRFHEKEKAIDVLHKMVEGIKINDINNPGKFSSVWCFNEIPEGERTITINLYENMLKILEQPVFDLIRKNDTFACIISDLKDLEEKSLK